MKSPANTMTVLPRWAVTTRRIVTILAIALLVPAVVLFFGLMFLTTLDVVLRLVLKHPLPGVVDVTKTMMLTLCWLGAAWVMIKERHISIDLLVSHLRPRALVIVRAVNSFLGLFFFAIVTWGGVIYAVKAWRLKATLEVLTAIPDAPFRFAIVVGASLLCVVLLIRFLEQLGKAVKGMSEADPEETSHKKEAGIDSI